MEVPLAVAQELIAKRELSLEDLERETGMKDTSKLGSDASRRKQASIASRFVGMVMNDSTILDKYKLKAEA